MASDDLEDDILGDGGQSSRLAYLDAPQFDSWFVVSLKAQRERSLIRNPNVSYFLPFASVKHPSGITWQPKLLG
jgi:hypothetical protein